MPIYDYVCRSCGHVLEVIHGRNDPGPSTCPVCGGEMRRAMSAPAIVFKGSGWAKKERSSQTSISPKEASESGKVDKSAKSDAGTAKAGEDSKSAGSDGAGTSSGASSSEAS